MKILILDDEKNDANAIKKCIENFFSVKYYDYHIDICESTDYLLAHLKDYDLVFLDVEIRGENGIDIGLKVREQNRDIRIIIVSYYTKYLIDGYKIQADRYFLKPFTQREFNIEFENIVYNYFQNELGFYDEKLSANKIYFKDILYIDFLNRKSYLHMINNKTLTTSYSLNYWEKILEKQYFSKPHKSYLVNLAHVGKFVKENIIMKNNDSISITRKFKDKFKSDYVNYLHRGV